ncbi:MAG: radical SAM protein [Clostridia bacterium]|nr:radical SAM protein [Clostridia bacterium]
MKKNIPIFVTHYGCPNQCVFCNQKKISGVNHAVDLAECELLLNQAVKYNYPPEETEIAFFGGSFTGIPLEMQKKYLKLAEQFRQYFYGVRLSTRPDYITPSILDMLLEHGVTTIELGVQSTVDAVLEKNLRKMTHQDTVNAVELIRKYPFSLGLQMMVSMYGASDDDDIRTADEIIALKPDFVRIYPTVVLENTKLYELYQAGEYQIKSLEQTVCLTAEIYRKFLNAKIPVIRVGLMASEEINSQNIIGAYHEAFGELVQNEIYYQIIKEQLNNKKTIGKKLYIYCGEKEVSKVAGHKRKNILRLNKEFSFCDVKVCPDPLRKAYQLSLKIEQ